MLHLVSEQFDSHWDGMEYGLLGPERISQLEREDLDRYHRSILKSSSYCNSMDGGIRSKADEDANMDQETINEVLLQFRDETKSEMAEMKAQMSLIISLLQDPCKQQEANISDPDEAANEIEEMVTRSPSEIHEDDIYCDSVGSIEMVSRSDILKENVVEAYAHKLFDGTPSLLSIEVDKNLCAVLGKMSYHTNARKVFTEMLEPILEENLVSIEVSTDAHYLLDGRPTLPPVHSEGLYGNTDSPSPNPYIIETESSDNWRNWVSGLLLNLSKVISQDLSYEDDILRVSSTNSPSLSKLGFNPKVFDPGRLAFFKHDKYENNLKANKRQLHCISSEFCMVYPQVSDESSVYNHLVIEVCCGLMDWARRSRNNLIDWVWGVQSSMELLLWNCSTWLWGCNIARVDYSIQNNDTSTVAHDIWSNRPFADFCVSALPHICTTFQASSKLPNGHYMVLRHSDIYFTDVGLLIQRLPFVFFGKSILDLAIVEHPSYTNNNFGCQNAALQKVMHQNTLLSEGLKPTQIWVKQSNTNELLVVGFNFNNLTLVDSGGDRKYALRYSYSGGIVPPLFVKAQGTGVISSLRPVHSKLLSNFLYCWSLFLEVLTNKLDLVTSFGSWIDLSPVRAEFAWDPGGICAILVYILEDKDVFERVGKWIISMDHSTESTVTMPRLKNRGEDHFGAIALQQAGDMTYASVQSSKLGNNMKDSDRVKEQSTLLSFSLQILYPRHLLANTLKDLHSLMIPVFNDGIFSVNFKRSSYHLLALALFQRYKVRKLKKTGVPMRILKYSGLYRYSKCSLWSKFGWVRTSIVWPSRCTMENEEADYIAFEVKRSAHHLLNEDMYAIQGGSPWFHMVWCSLKTNDDKQVFYFGFGEHNNAGSFCTVFRWKVGPNVATLLGLVSSIVTLLPHSNVFIGMACISFNAYKRVWKKFIAKIPLTVEVLSKPLGDRVLIHLVTTADGDYNIQNFGVGIMVKSGSNACNYVLLLDGGMNTSGNDKGQWLNGRGYNLNCLVAVVTNKVNTLLVFGSDLVVWDNMVRELEHYIWDPGWLVSVSPLFGEDRDAVFISPP